MSSLSSASGVTRVYKIVSRSDWDVALAAGRFEGVGIDQVDGFIHLSTAAQVAGTLERFFAGRTDLLLVEMPTAMFADADGRLRFEAATDQRAGAFPHLFGGGFDVAGLTTHEIRVNASGAFEPMRLAD